MTGTTDDVAAGCMIHPVLQPLLVGAPGIPWTARAAPALYAALTASVLYYTTCRGPGISEYAWELRMDPKTGREYSSNVFTGAREEGAGAAINAAAFRTSFAWVPAMRAPIRATYNLLVRSVGGGEGDVGWKSVS